MVLDSLVECLWQLCNLVGEVQFELFVVVSIEDVIIVVVLNGEIQVVIICYDLLLWFCDWVLLMIMLLGIDGDEVVVNEIYDWVECVEWICELWFYIDFYLFIDELIVVEIQDEFDVYDCIFYWFNDVIDLYSMVFVGL